MSVIKFSDKIIEKFPTVGEYIQTKYYKQLVYYVIDSKYRKSVKLSNWVKEQVENPGDELLLLIEKIPKHKNADYQMKFILNYIKRVFTYVGDERFWSIKEKWQTANTSAKLMHGDCEDGAILMYVIARILGIASNKLLIFAGDVKGGGHAFLGYRPKNFPLNWAILDWCYWYDSRSISTRNLFFVDGRTFIEYKKQKGELYKKIDSKYYTMWFGFNEEASFRTISLKS